VRSRWLTAIVVVLLGVVAVYPSGGGDLVAPWLLLVVLLLVVWLCWRFVASVLRRIREGSVHELFIAPATDDAHGRRLRPRRVRSLLIASVAVVVWAVALALPNQTVGDALAIATFPLFIWLIARAVASLVRRLGRVGEDPHVARPPELDG
jgi:hypothetical protein